jgi:LAO/AO transport system kinase
VRDWVEVHALYLDETGQRARREATRAAATLDHILRDRLIAALLARLPAGRLEQTIDAITRRGLDPYTAADQLLA